jgi:ubiquinone/menaquinone biosynthesis C-methylase UbiE
MKLHLGCGNKRIEGFINIDCRYLPAVDRVENIRFLRSFENDSAELIYASHVLEHFSRWEYKQCLQRWYDILQPGGVARIAIPDFEKICEHYNKFKDLRILSGILYGGQDYVENNHFWCWDFKQIEKDLTDVGFKAVERYNWWETEHAHVDDCSQAYLPHMDKDNGMLMSLNIEAVK